MLLLHYADVKEYVACLLSGGMKIVVSRLPGAPGCYTSLTLGRLSKRRIYWPIYMAYRLSVSYYYNLTGRPVWFRIIIVRCNLLCLTFAVWSFVDIAQEA
jgi:hypothetical protein